MSTTDSLALIGEIVVVIVPLAGLIWYIINHRSEWKKIFLAGVATVLIMAALLAGVNVAASQLSQSTPSSTPSPGTPALTPTPASSPIPTPSPTPPLITITKNLDIPCIACGYKLDIKLTTIVIDTTKQESTWNFTLTNNGNPIESLFFSTLVLEDNTGQKHQGGGLASTDRWNMSSGQSIQTYATFDVVQGTNFLLYISVDDGPYQTETITF